MGKGEKNQLKISLRGSTKHKKTLQTFLKFSRILTYYEGAKVPYN